MSTTIEGPWHIWDFGHSPVTIVASGEGPAIAKVFVTEYRKRTRSPELIKVARLIAETPTLLKALRNLVDAADDCDELDEARAVLARIDILIKD